MLKVSYLKRAININYNLFFHSQSKYATKEISFHVPVTEISSLNNNLRIASENWNTRTSTVGMWIDAGSRYETLSNNGVAHFLEHMAFKGAEKRTLKSLELEVENKGAHLNAYTSREMTVYYAKCLNKDIEWGVELLADILRNSKYENTFIERERGVILREMEEIASTYQEVVFDYLHETAYRGSSLGWTILGPEENVKSLKQKDLRSFVDQHYRGDKMILTGVGGVDHKYLASLGEKYFGSVLRAVGPECDLEKGNLSSKFTGSGINEVNDRMPLAYVALAIEGPGTAHTDSIALMVASCVNGSWDRNNPSSGTATCNIATRFSSYGNVNNFQHFYTTYHDTSLWGIYLTSEGNGLKQSIDVVIDEWQRLCTHISVEEVQRAKNNLKTNLLMMLDGTTPVCEEIGRHILSYGRRIPPDEMMHRIDMLDVDDIRRVCTKYIRNRDPASASIGLVKDFPDYQYIQGRFHW